MSVLSWRRNRLSRGAVPSASFPHAAPHAAGTAGKRDSLAMGSVPLWRENRNGPCSIASKRPANCRFGPKSLSSPLARLGGRLGFADRHTAGASPTG